MSMRSVGLRQLLLLCLAAPADCLTAAPTAAQAPASRNLLIGELGAKATSEFGPVDPSLVQYRSRGSVVVPGLTYEWASYRPPHTADVQFLAVVARRGERRRVVRTPSDWARVVGRWTPADSGDATQACLELVDVAGERADPFRPPLLAVGENRKESMAPDSLGQAFGTVRASKGEDGRWTVLLPVLEKRRGAVYRCELALPDLARLRVVAVKDGAGLRNFTP